MLPAKDQIERQRKLNQLSIDTMHSACILLQLVIDARLGKLELEKERSRLTHLKTLTRYQSFRLAHIRVLIKADKPDPRFLVLYNQALDKSTPLATFKEQLKLYINELRLSKFIMHSFNEKVRSESNSKA